MTQPVIQPATIKTFQFNKKWEQILWSYIGGAVTAMGGYAIAYAYKLINNEHATWNWKLFALLAISGLLAPVFKAVNPLFKEFGVFDLLKPFESRIVQLVGTQLTAQTNTTSSASTIQPL
jgi:hypothetical protein